MNKMIRFGDLFTDQQISDITALYNKHGNTSKLHAELKTYFRAIEPPLESKGLLPDYAAYAVPFWIEQCLKSKPKQKPKSKVTVRTTVSTTVHLN